MDLLQVGLLIILVCLLTVLVKLTRIVLSWAMPCFNDIVFLLAYRSNCNCRKFLIGKIAYIFSWWAPTHLFFFTKNFSKISYVCASEKIHEKLEPPALDDRLFRTLEMGEEKTELHSCAVTAVHAPWYIVALEITYLFSMCPSWHIIL